MQLLAQILLNRLLNLWSNWDDNKDFYIHKLYPRVIADPTSDTTKEEEKLLVQIKRLTSDEELLNLGVRLEEIRDAKYSIQDIIDQSVISCGDFSIADVLFIQTKDLSIYSISPIEYEKEKKVYQQRITKKISSLIESEQFTEAEHLYTKCHVILPDVNIQALIVEYQNEKKRKSMMDVVIDLFLRGKYQSADEYFLQNRNVLLTSVFEEIKKQYIQKDLDKLSNAVGLKFDNEKAIVLAKTGQFVQIKARAGSGKTTAVALKVRQLINTYGAKPNEIMVLAFNRKAAIEFQERINSYCQAQTVDKTNSSTFHSLAYRLVNPGLSLLFNDTKDGGRFVIGQQSEYIGLMYRRVYEEDRKTIRLLLYKFFRAITREKGQSEFKSQEDFYLYRRNLEYVSLGGERVKSRSEKIIADYLFEHKIFKSNQEIQYQYEWSLPGGKRRYKPDFSFWIKNGNKNGSLVAILEYFGITQNHPASRDYMSKEEEENYLREIRWKRSYCENNNINFIETSVDDLVTSKLTNERVSFENVINQRLIKSGFTLQPLSQEDVIRKMLEAKANLDPFFDQMTAFINRAKKQLLTPRDVENLLNNQHANLGERTGSFLEIIRRVYLRYEDQKLKDNKIDFDDLLSMSVDKIVKTGGNCELEILGSSKKIKDIQYILIDEYQDFSKSFYHLIEAIIRVNPAVRVFCVGDDWQAINGFAGSDLEYFSDFDHYFAEGKTTELLTNHRSDTAIVQFSNEIMTGLGDAGIPEAGKSTGRVYLRPIPFVEWRNQPEYQNEYANDELYRTRVKLLECWQNREMDTSRYLKAINQIIVENTQKEICFLFRTNSICGANIERLGKLLSAWYPQEKIICSTAHSYKGKESTVVVIMDANRANYPKLHPDNDLMEILGVTIPRVLEEERHLFYVATTRAKETLYLLYEEEKGPSDFIPKGWSFDTE